MINKNLKWSNHIAVKVAKANSILGLLRKNMYGCTETAKKKAFMALVGPHLEYCTPVGTLTQEKI